MTILTLADLKAHLNVTDNVDDDLLNGKIAAAEGWIAAFIGTEDLSTLSPYPAPLLEATRQLAAHLYENREASVIGVHAEALPFGVCDLLAPYRTWVF